MFCDAKRNALEISIRVADLGEQNYEDENADKNVDQMKEAWFIARRSRDLDMAACLLLLDFQHGILRSGRVPFEDAAIPEDAIAAAQDLVSHARANNVPVIQVGVQRSLVRGSFDRPRSEAATKSGKAPRDVLPMAAGSEDIAFVIEPKAGEEVIYKMGVGAFAGTRLEMLLRNLSAETICVAGAFTHMVVESTVRHGFDLGFAMSVAGFACCAPNRAIHQNALSSGIPNFARLLGDPDAAKAVLT